MYKNRKILQSIQNLLQKSPAIILVGARQVGKTSIMKALQLNLEEENNKTLYFDMEFPSNLEIFSHGVENFLQYLKSINLDPYNNIEKNIYIFLDEFQYIPDAGKLIKLVADNFQHLKIIASGSSSVDIQKAMKESSVGRKRIINIYPIDFSEYLYFLDKKEASFFRDISIKGSLSPSIIQNLNNEFYEFLIWGGMPQVVLTKDVQEKIEMLEEICSSYILKDIKGLVGIQNISIFNNFMRILAQESSSIFNLNSLANTLKVSRNILEEYLFILESTFVSFQFNPFFTNKRKELSKAKKNIFYDSGMRNFLIKNTSNFAMRQDKGYLTETVVYNEIIKNIKTGMYLYYWRTLHQTEVDLVIQKDSTLVPIEIKSGDIIRAPKALISFAKQYKSQYAFVVNNSIYKTEICDGVKIIFLPLFMVSKIPAYIGDKECK